MRAATLLLTFMAPLATALMGETQVGRLVVVSAPKDAHLPSSSSLTPEGVVSTMASLANHALHPSSLLSAFSRNGLNAFLQPRTNLLVVVDGAPLAFSSDLTGQETFPITSSGAQESSRELVDRMLTGRALTSTKSFGTLADSLCQYYKGGMVVAASPSEQMLAVVSPHRESLAPSSNFYGASFSPKTGKAILAPNSKATGTFDAIFAAKDLQAYNVVLNSGETLFDETVQEDRAFLLEMKALASFLPEIRRSDLSALASDSAADSYTFASTSLQGLSRKYGPSSLQHQHAWLKLTAVLSEVKAQFAELASDNGAFEVLLLDDAVHASPVSRRSIQKRDYTNIASRCYDSEALCLEATGVNSTTTNSTVPCSGHGQCFLVKQATQPERFCYRCKCDHDYTGDKCEFIDIVAPFHIIFWLSLTLLLALALITYGMANMDPGKDTLLFRTVSPKQKRE